MIDRSLRILPLRTRTLLISGTVSAILFCVLPAAALVCLVVALVGALGCLIPIGFAWVLMIGGIVGGIAIFGAIGNGGGDGAGCGGLIAGIIVIALCVKAGQGILAAYDYVAQAAVCVHWGQKLASLLAVDLLIDKRLGAYAWIPLGLALSVAGLTLLLIWLLGLVPLIGHVLLRQSFTCDKCHRRGQPHCRCACSELATDLRPSAYGILFAKCRACGQSLPTCALSGRSKLQMICPHSGCSGDLNVAGLGVRPEYYFALAGAVSSGKSTLLTSSVRSMERFASCFGCTLSIPDPAHAARYRTNVAVLDGGGRLPKTAEMAMPPAFNVALSDPAGAGPLLYFYDTAGESFAEETRLRGHHFHRFLDGILFIVDPFAEPPLVQYLRETGQLDDQRLRDLNPASSEAEGVLDPLVAQLERICRARPQPTRIAVVVTKADAMGAEGHAMVLAGPSARFVDIADCRAAAARLSPGVRSFLCERGEMEHFAQKLESQFVEVCYFAVSARQLPADAVVDQLSASAFWPLAWLCASAGALDTHATPLFALRNLRTAAMRAWRGQEGTPAQLAVWSLAAAAAILIFTGIWRRLGFVAAMLFCVIPPLAPRCVRMTRALWALRLQK